MERTKGSNNNSFTKQERIVRIVKSAVVKSLSEYWSF